MAVSITDTVSLFALATSSRRPSLVVSIALGCAPTGICATTFPRAGSTTATVLSFQHETKTLSALPGRATARTSYG